MNPSPLAATRRFEYFSCDLNERGEGRICYHAPFFLLKFLFGFLHGFYHKHQIQITAVDPFHSCDDSR